MFFTQNSVSVNRLSENLEKCWSILDGMYSQHKYFEKQKAINDYKILVKNAIETLKYYNQTSLALHPRLPDVTELPYDESTDQINPKYMSQCLKSIRAINLEKINKRLSNKSAISRAGIVASVALAVSLFINISDLASILNPAIAYGAIMVPVLLILIAVTAASISAMLTLNRIEYDYFPASAWDNDISGFETFLNDEFKPEDASTNKLN